MNMHVTGVRTARPDIARVLEEAWADRALLRPGREGPVAEAVAEALAGLDAGRYRVAEKADGAWTINR